MNLTVVSNSLFIIIGIAVLAEVTAGIIFSNINHLNAVTLVSLPCSPSWKFLACQLVSKGWGKAFIMGKAVFTQIPVFKTGKDSHVVFLGVFLLTFL